MSQLENSPKIERLENLIAHAANNNLEGVVEHIRSSYVQILNIFLQLLKKYKHFKLKITDDALKRYTHLIDNHIYDESGKIKWSQISVLMPPNLEKRIKMEYDMLSDNEVKLCCLALFEVDPDIICDILPFSQSSVYVIKSKIKQKTGMKKIREHLKYLLFA